MPTDLIALLSPRNLILFIIVLTRLSGMITRAPLISAYPIPVQIKAWFMASFALILFPILSSQSGFQVPTSMPELILILLREFMIGYITGFVANVVFVAMEVAGDLISMQIGLTAAQAMNPMTGDQSPVFTQAYTVFASMIFISLNAYQWLFSAVYKTFEILPPGYKFFVSGNLAHNVIFYSCEMFSIGFSIAIPLFAVMIIADFLLGFTAKMMPKMNIFMVALPVKIYLGFVLFLILLPQMGAKIAILIETHLSSIIAVLGG